MTPTTRTTLAAAIAKIMDDARHGSTPLPATAGLAVIRAIERHGLRIVEWPPPMAVIRAAMVEAWEKDVPP